MRIRTIKPEFWRSDDITRLPMDVRLLFIGLWSYVDDNGVGADDERRIAGDLFALEHDQVKIRMWIEDGLAELAQVMPGKTGPALITRYEVGGKRYLHITNWSKHQLIARPNKARLPGPNLASQKIAMNPNGVQGTAIQPNGTHGTPVPGAVEQGNRGTEEEQPSPATSPGERKPKMPKYLVAAFTAFWKAYPRKVGKIEAERRFAQAVKEGTPAEVLIGGATRYAKSVATLDEKFIPYPSAWLHQGRWDDATEKKLRVLAPPEPGAW